MAANLQYPVENQSAGIIGIIPPMMHYIEAFLPFFFPLINVLLHRISHLLGRNESYCRPGRK